MADTAADVAAGSGTGSGAGVSEPYGDVLVVDLLGGIGDLIMMLPVVHGLARRNPGASVRVLTHEPGADLLRGDPTVTEVRVPRHGGPHAEREAVADALSARTPGLAVTTTRYDGIPALLAASGARCVTDLWRRPPPDEPIGERYLRILVAEGLLGPDDLSVRPRVALTPGEVAAGERLLVERLPAAERPPVVLVTEAGMDVKRWPTGHWRELAAVLRHRGHPVLALDAPRKHVRKAHAAVPVTENAAEAVADSVPGAVADSVPGAVALPRCGLRTLAGLFAAVARRSGVVVGGDTGPLRLAGAAGAATVGLFGPTTAARYGIGGPSAVNLQGLAECPHRLPTTITEQPCWWTAACPLSSSGPACMADIPPLAVAEAVTRLTRLTRPVTR